MKAIRLFGFIVTVSIISFIVSYSVNETFTMDSNEKVLAIHNCLTAASDNGLITRPLKENLIEYATVSGNKFAQFDAIIRLNKAS